MDKRINRDRFIYLMENIGLLTTCCHMEGKTLVTDDEKLTEEIELLKLAVQRFEKETGIIIKILDGEVVI